MFQTFYFNSSQLNVTQLLFFFFTFSVFLKKNQNAPRPSEHPPVMGKKMSKRLGGIKGCNQPEKTTLHGGGSRSWSAEQGKENITENLTAHPPPPPLPPRSCSFREEKINHVTRLHA